MHEGGDEHSVYGGSKASIWLRCPRSPHESEKWPEAPSSPYAEKGTDEHSLAAHCLSNGDRNANNYIGAKMQHARAFTVTRAMADAVNVYLNDAWNHIAPTDEYFVEQSFSLHTISNQLFGRNDLVAYRTDDQELWLWDYKGGAGVFIEAEGNEQLAFYMVGAVLSYFIDRPITRIVLTIVQPNYDCESGPIRRWALQPHEVFDWIDKFKTGYRAAQNPDAPWVPGPHCRWCAGAAGCDALHLKALDGFMDGAAVKPPDPTRMTSLDMGHRLRQATIIELWIKTLRERAYAEALAGRCPDGFKLVEKRATRKWTGADETILAGITGAFPDLKDEQLVDWKIRSPAQIEKIVGKDDMAKLSDLIVKESSGTTLVPESDGRDAVARGIEGDFGDIIKTGDAK